MLHNAQKRYSIPIIVHIDLNAKLTQLKMVRKYLDIKAWYQFQDDQYSWRAGRKKANNDIII